MKRHALLTAVVAAALALSACSSGGTAGAGSGGSAGQSASAPSAAESAPSSSGGQASAPEQAPSSGAASGSDASGSDASGDDQQDPPTVTASGDIDGQSAAWFSAFCTGMSPIFSLMFGVDVTATGAAKQKAYVDAFNQMGDAFTATAKSLSALPPPTISNGEQLAAATVQTLTQAGPAMKQAAQAIAAVDPSDKKALEAAIEAANEQTESALKGMDKFTLDDSTQTALSAIPACKVFADDASSSSSATG